MIVCRPDNRVSLPRSSGTSKIYTKGCSLDCRSWASSFALNEALHHGGHFSCMGTSP